MEPYDKTLKRLLIRCDYSGASASGVEEWINKEKSGVLRIFNSYDEADCGAIKIDLSDLKNATEDSGLNIKELNKGHLYIFGGGESEEMPESVTLEISHFFMTMTVKYKKYEGEVRTDPYFSIMSDVIESLLKNDKFIRINRYGIRNLNVFGFDSLEKMKTTLNEKSINTDLFAGDLDFGSRQYKDIYRRENEDQTETEVMVYKRELKTIKDKDGQTRWIVMIDSDCSNINRNNLRPEKKHLFELSGNLLSRINYLFKKSLLHEGAGE